MVVVVINNLHETTEPFGIGVFRGGVVGIGVELAAEQEGFGLVGLLGQLLVLVE